MAKGSETGGCLNCYAARMAARNLPELKSPTTNEPFAVMRDSGPRWTGKVELIEHLLSAPQRWRKPARIFVNSMSDLFHETLPFQDIVRVMQAMQLAPQHTYQILTKRPERALEFFRGQPPLPNIWLGVSTENQATADVRLPLLLEIPATVRFVSYEPTLGPVDFRPFLPGVGWIIVGGESGPGARTFDVQWAADVISQCKAAGVACFVKQLGAKPVGSPKLTDRKGGNWAEWTASLRIRQFPLEASHNIRKLSTHRQTST